MATDQFFAEPSQQSRVKADIVANYFRGWANVMLTAARQRGHARLGYQDLFAGPGHYDDGTKSTPLLILEHAVADPRLSEMLVAEFNDANPRNAASLREAIARIPGIERLRHAPVVSSRVIDIGFAQELERRVLPPSLIFVDPFGYIGLSLRLIKAAVASWGCDCIFFFNYRRINAGLSNDLFAERMNDIYGEARANRLRPQLVGLSVKQREDRVVKELLDGLKAECGKFALRFPFATDSGTQTSHYLMFVTKGRKGHDIMKGVMATRSTASPEGVPSLRFNPAERLQPTLPGMNFVAPLVDLENELLDKYAGRQIAFQRLYDEHNIDTNYMMKNYREVLLQMEERGRIVVRPPAADRPQRDGKPTLATDVVITFPRQTKN